MLIATDRRRLDLAAAPGAATAFRAGLERIRDGEVYASRALAQIDASGEYLASGCSSAIDYAVRHGVDRQRAGEMLRAGRVLLAAPRTEQALREGRLTSRAAAEVGKVLDLGRGDSGEAANSASDAAVLLPDELMPPGPADTVLAPPVDVSLDTLLSRAETLSPSALRREVRARVEGHAQREAVVPMAFAVAESVRHDFRRARTLASRKAGAALTDGQALAVVTRDYLARHDPLLRTRRARRVGPTSERPEDRYIPAEVRAAVLARSGDRCEFPGCGFRTFLQFAHLVWHRDDGDREIPNLLRLCTKHHVLLDAGRIEFLGFGTEGGAERAQFMIVETGEVVSARTTDPDGHRAARPRDRPPGRYDHPSSVRERAPPYGRRDCSATGPVGRRRGRRAPGSPASCPDGPWASVSA